MSDRVAIVANPYSGARANRQRVEALCAALSAEGIAAEVIWEPAGQSKRLAEGSWLCVVAAGGDGTVASVFNSCTTWPLVILPLGNENLLARELGFSHDVEAMAQAIARGNTRCMDLGRVGNMPTQVGTPSGRRFALMVSAGFDGECAHRLSRWRSAIPGRLRRVRHVSYVNPIFCAALGYHYPVMRVLADGREMRGALAMVFNTPQYALRLPLAPEASTDDGLLDYVVFEHPGRWAMLGYALSLVRGRHRTRPDVHHGQAQRIEIQCEEPVPVQIDGDACGFAPLVIDVEKAALKVIETGNLS